MFILETERLVITELTIEDSSFMFDLLTMPSWIKWVGDRNIKSNEDAGRYIANRIQQSYRENGFGFWKVNLKSDNTYLGICGIVKRPTLEHIDIGYGFLENQVRKGYAFEATKRVYDYATNDLNIKTIVAITDPDNQRSIRLLEKLGMHFVELITEDEYGVSALYSNEME